MKEYRGIPIKQSVADHYKILASGSVNYIEFPNDVQRTLNMYITCDKNVWISFPDFLKIANSVANGHFAIDTFVEEIRDLAPSYNEYGGYDTILPELDSNNVGSTASERYINAKSLLAWIDRTVDGVVVARRRFINEYAQLYEVVEDIVTDIPHVAIAMILDAKRIAPLFSKQLAETEA